MSNPIAPRPAWRDYLSFLLPCLVVAVVVRLYFFSGVSLADDVNYWTQAIATGINGDWPPMKQHWHVRLGLVLPCALLLKIFGLKFWAPYIFTMLGGLLEIVLIYHIARRLTNESTARLAAWLCVFYPLSVLYSTYLFVDLWAGVTGAASLYFWHRGLVADRIRYYALSSAFFGIAWLFRETVMMCLPIFIALWIHSRRWHSRKFLWIFPPALLILGGELLLHELSSGNWHYRFDAIFGAQGQLKADFSSVKSFWLEPLVELLTSHEMGIFMVSALFIAALRFSRYSRPLALWLLVGFGWFCWGTMVPFAWLPLQGDPRYLTVLNIPCLILLAAWVNGLGKRVWRIATVSLLILSALICCEMDLGTVKKTAYQRFAKSKYNSPEVALEPFIYFGTRAALGFRTNNVHFACASDLGRATAMKQMDAIPGTRIISSDEAHYLVVTPDTHYEKMKKQTTKGWKVVAAIRGKNNPLRDAAVKFLTYFGQPGRREPIVRKPTLVILENPHWPPEKITSQNENDK